MEAPLAEVIVPGRSCSPTPVITPAREDGGGGPVVCSLCLSGPGKYTCPRCNSPYCSLACYRGPRHTACSELFYRESVLQALREEEAEPHGRKQLEEMLLRLREEPDLDGVMEAAGRTDLAGVMEAAGRTDLAGVMEAAGRTDLAGVMEAAGRTDLAGVMEAAGRTDLAGVMEAEEAELWNRLSGQEKDQFTRLLQSGDIGALVPQWKPWWHPEEIRHKKILEFPEGNDGCDPSRIEMAAKAHHTNNKTPDAIEEPAPNARQNPAITDGLKDGVGLGVHGQTSVTAIPPLLSSLPPLSSLSRNPSPLVKYTVVNVIYAYAFSLLRHNGDVSDNDILLHFIGTLLSVSSALSTNAVYNSTGHALKSAVRAASDPQFGGDRNLACSAMEATSQILHGDESKTFTLAALSHLFRLLGKVRKQIDGEKDVRKGAFSAKKKCLFLAAWVNENEDCLVMLSREIMAEYKQYLDELTGVEEISRELQKVWGGKRPQEKKKLVQEVGLSTNEP